MINIVSKNLAMRKFERKNGKNGGQHGWIDGLKMEIEHSWKAIIPICGENVETLWAPILDPRLAICTRLMTAYVSKVYHLVILKDGCPYNPMRHWRAHIGVFD
jgi:hypothetical protein